MIGYRVSRAELRALIEAEKPGWLVRADERTRSFRDAGKYAESSSIWSEIKLVYMRLQGEAKCVYCERKLESEELGKGEQDVEHFRPKSSVRAWPGSDALTQAGVNITVPPKPAPGYHLLPYDIFNYSASCKPCNSALKSDCFPVAGDYRFAGAKPEALKSEKPLLIYPIGDFDESPEDLIAFHGVMPMPVAKSGHRRHRALTTIEFFALDDFSRRKNLVRERAMIIVALHPFLETLRQGSGDLVKARKLVDGFTSAKSAHANCARSFVGLHGRDPAAAQEVMQAAADFIVANS